MTTLHYRFRAAARRQGWALLTAIIFIVVLLLLGVSFLGITMQELNHASRERKEQRAFALAEAGVEYAAWRAYVADPSFPTTWTRQDFPEGSFTVTVNRYYDAGGNLVPRSMLVTSTGRSQNWTSTVKVVGQFLPRPFTNNGIFDYALFSDTNLNLSGTANVSGNIRSNGRITLQGSARVVGDATSASTISDPKNKITGTKQALQPKLTMPTIDLAYYRENATTVKPNGYVFSGTTTLNGITYVDGDCHLSGQVEGNGIIVASGTVYVDGNVTLANPNSELAIASAGTVRVNGTCQIDGFIYTHSLTVSGTFGGLGSANVTGGVVADVVSVSGTITVTYKKPLQEMPGSDKAPAQFDAIGWRRIR